MAFRAAVNAGRRVAGVISVGGDIPPEITPDELKRVSAALLARGMSDNLYTEEQFRADERRLRQSSVRVNAVVPEAGHEWPGDLIDGAAQFLQQCHPESRV